MAHSRSKERFRRVGTGSTEQMDPTGDHCMFPCSGSKTQAHKQRTGEGRGEGAWGQPWWVTGVLVCWRPGSTWCTRADRLQLPEELEGGACSVIRRSHLGIWVQLWNLNPKSRGGSREAGALEMQAFVSVLKALGMSRSERMDWMAREKGVRVAVFYSWDTRGCKGSLQPFKCINSRLTHRRKRYDSIDRQKFSWQVSGLWADRRTSWKVKQETAVSTPVTGGNQVHATGPQANLCRCYSLWFPRTPSSVETWSYFIAVLV